MDINNIFSRKTTSNSKDIARDRLKLVIVYDRISCSTQLLEMLKTDIIRVISNYIEIDEHGLDIKIGRANFDNGNVPVLCANIPIRSVNHPALKCEACENKPD